MKTIQIVETEFARIGGYFTYRNRINWRCKAFQPKKMILAGYVKIKLPTVI